jgi:hypothetical protein
MFYYNCIVLQALQYSAIYAPMDIILPEISPKCAVPVTILIHDALDVLKIM